MRKVLVCLLDIDGNEHFQEFLKKVHEYGIKTSKHFDWPTPMFDAMVETCDEEWLTQNGALVKPYAGFKEIFEAYMNARPTDDD